MHRSVREYLEKFDDLPGIPMIQCSGRDDERYIAMCEAAVKRGTPVTDEDYDEFFPMDEDAWY